MTFISSSEGKNVYFMSGKARNEIYIFWLHDSLKIHLREIIHTGYTSEFLLNAKYLM